MNTRDILEQSWKILPVPDDRTGRPEGFDILDELGEGGTLLFRIYRAIRARAALGTAVMGTSRDEVVADAVTHADDAMWDALREVTCVYDQACGRRQISAAAERVATILAQKSHLRSAAAFRRAAAAITPSDALASYRAGRAMRETGHYSEAEVWLDRAIVLGRQQKEWKAYVLSYIAYGRLHRERGANPRAERHFLRAFRRARRESLHMEAAMAAHDLMTIELERSDFEKASDYSRIALSGYGANTAELLRLAHDIGWQYLDLGQFQEAVSVFEALTSCSDDPVVSTSARANLCRAYAALGHDEMFRVLRDQVLREAADFPAFHAEWILELAAGARSLRDYETSRTDALHALRIAEDRSQQKVVFRARALVDSLRSPIETDSPTEVREKPFIPAQEILAALAER